MCSYILSALNNINVIIQHVFFINVGCRLQHSINIGHAYVYENLLWSPLATVSMPKVPLHRNWLCLRALRGSHGPSRSNIFFTAFSLSKARMSEGPELRYFLCWSNLSESWVKKEFFFCKWNVWKKMTSSFLNI